MESSFPRECRQGRSAKRRSVARQCLRQRTHAAIASDWKSPPAPVERPRIVNRKLNARNPLLSDAFAPVPSAACFHAGSNFASSSAVMVWSGLHPNQSGQHANVRVGLQNTRAQQARHYPLRVSRAASISHVLFRCHLTVRPRPTVVQVGQLITGLAGLLMRSTGNRPVAGGSSRTPSCTRTTTRHNHGRKRF